MSFSRANDFSDVDSFTLSPVYPAARSLLGHERGVSIRFPRFIKVREDKSIENATTAEQLAELFEKQAVVEPAKKGKQTEEDEE
jgi:DNA ligase-1